MRKWICEGSLKAWRLPRGRHLRLLKGDLIDCLETKGLSLGNLDFERSRKIILYTNCEQRVGDFQNEASAFQSPFQVEVVSNFFELGYQLKHMQPGYVFLDFETSEFGARTSQVRCPINLTKIANDGIVTVSYTHLTLPTILLV